MITSGILLAVLQLTLANELQDVIDEWLAEASLPGVSVSVTVGPDVAFAGGSGLADLESGEPMTAETRLYAGSLTKVFTATLVLHLVEQGRLSLDQPVAGIADDSPVTIRQLLAHSAGLDREGDFGYWFSARFPDREALSEYLDVTTLATAPGAEVRYSNVGYAALGLAIEDATGLTYGEALIQQVARPLGLAATGAPGPVDDIARGYTPRNRLIPSASRPFAGVGRAVGERHLREYHDARAMAPAFGAYSTAGDLGRLAQFLLGDADGNVLDAESRAMLLQRGSDGRSLGLGNGEFRGRPVARHSGWFAAHRSYLLIDLEDRIGIAVIANSDDARPGVIAERLLATVLDHRPDAD